MIRIVVDPGILVAAAISPNGLPARLVQAAREGTLHFVLSPILIDELAGVLDRPKFRRYLSKNDAERFVRSIRGLGEMSEDPLDRPHVSRDVDDDYLVALARAAAAQAIVSSDHALTELRILPPVVTPREMLEMLERLP